MKIFLAASSKDREQARVKMKELNDLGHECFDWTRDPGFENPQLLDSAKSAHADYDALRQADGFIWMLTENLSQGAAFEFGAAYQMGIPCVILCQDDIPKEHIYAFLDGTEWACTITGAVQAIQAAIEVYAVGRTPF